MMFGFACDETPELMPRRTIAIAHALTRRLAQARKAGNCPFLRPDGKSQVTVEYDENGKVTSCPAIVVSTQHDPKSPSAICGKRSLKQSLNRQSHVI
jgi:S-adenosylmethionine synthetase